MKQRLILCMKREGMFQYCRANPLGNCSTTAKNLIIQYLKKFPNNQFKQLETN